MAIVTILIGLAGVLGWVLKLPALYTFMSNGASMKFIGAFSTVLTGAALLSINNVKTIVAQLFTWVVLLIGIATIAEYLFNIDLKVDIIFSGSSATGLSGELPGRMSLYTAILFVLLSAGLLLFTIKRFFAGQCIALLGALMTYSALLGILFNIGNLFTFGHFSAISFPTVIGFLATSSGLLLYSADKGWLPEVFGQHSAAQAARYAILYFFTATPVFVDIFLVALKYTAFPPEFTIVILIIGTVACTLPLAFRLLKKMNRADRNLYRLTRKLKKRTRQLADKNEALSRMNKDLDNIIHIISHDLKTPITSLKLSLDILEMALNSTADKSLLDLLAVPKRSTRQLTEMINHLGQTIKAQRPEQAVLEEIDICSLIEEIKATDLQAAIKNTGALIHTHIDDCSLIYEGIHVHSILQNLISNGIKYHFPGRQPIINVSAQKVQGGVRLTVQDNGLGIPEQELPHLFTKYKRFHQHVEGTGIGLYLTRQLLEARGGHIEVSSKEGEGTIFEVFIPI